MRTRIALFALALTLPLAACETEPEGDTITIETPDVDGAMDNAAQEIEAAGDNAAAEIDEAASDAGAAMDEAAAETREGVNDAANEVEEATDGDNNM